MSKPVSLTATTPAPGYYDSSSDDEAPRPAPPATAKKEPKGGPLVPAKSVDRKTAMESIIKRMGATYRARLPPKVILEALEPTPER